jgi:hypothetical protein
MTTWRDVLVADAATAGFTLAARRARAEEQPGITATPADRGQRAGPRLRTDHCRLEAAAPEAAPCAAAASR